MTRANREASIERNTNETQISVRVNLDGTGQYNVSTGIGFLDHMLEQLSRHSLMDLDVKAVGDLHIDFHHTTEDTGIAIGKAVGRALGDRKGIRRWRLWMKPARGWRWTLQTGLIWSGGSNLPGKSLVIWIPSCSGSGFRPLPRVPD